MNKSLLLPACLWLAGVSGIFAQAPSAPFREPAAPCKWVETFSYFNETKRPEDPASAARFDNRNRLSPKPKVRTFYDDGTIRREVNEWVSGKKTERWIVGDYVLYEPSNFTEKEIIYRLLDGSDLEQLRKCFPDLNWIKSEHARGNERYLGKSANLYEMSKANRLGETELFKAWIDSNTLLPIAMESSSVKIVYEFTKESPSKLVDQMPEDYKKILERMRKAELVP